MPKDITHWMMASEVLKRLNSDELQHLIRKNYAAYLIGAVAYDIPYYGLGKYAGILEEKANELHGSRSCDAWDPIVGMLRNVMTEDNCDMALVLALGCITHIITDSQFHPFIYYFTGNYNDSDTAKRNRAVFNHRLLETHLDLYILERGGYTGPKKAKELVEKLPRHALIKNLALMYFGTDGSEQVNMTQNCLDAYVKYQALFHNSALRYLSSIIGLANVEMKNISALFYPKSIEPAHYQLFAHNKQYRHPSSGEYVEASLDKICHDCMTVMLSAFSPLYSCTRVDEYLEVINSFSPLSLATGKECAGPSLMRYFSK